jgi:hypothetical protein
MEKHLSSDDARLYRLCDEALYYVWDPIGVSDSPQARDEYDSYLPRVFRLVKGRQRQELLDYLREVAVNFMGLPAAETEAEERTAAFLLDAAEWIDEMSEHSSSGA